jgi:HAD superfamily hydrolase (TIGR01458 family)
MPVLLIDLDGTVYTRGGAIEGAAAALDELRADGHVLRFLTNTDSKSTPQMLNTIAGKGLSVGVAELFTSVTAVEELLGGVRDPVLMTVTNDAVAGQLRARFPGHGPVPTHVVVGDVSDRLSYDLMDDAFRALRAGASLIALQKGRFYLSGDVAHLDTGAFVTALEYGAGVEALVVGKPSTSFLDLAVASTGAKPAADEVWVIGDDITTDVRMGHDAGVRTVLVRTGKYAYQRELTGVAAPGHVVNSIADLPALLRAAAR